MDSYNDEEPNEQYVDSPPQQEAVLGYREQEQRARAGANIMGTTIEGGGALARAQQRMESRQTGTTLDKRLLAYFAEVKPLYRRFAVDEEVLMFDKFHTLPHYQYKNPAAYLLAYIAFVEGTLTKVRLSKLMKLAADTNMSNISEADIIRYYRCLSKPTA